MKQFPLFITALAAALLTGCATADFTPYVGEQQKWPTAKGAFVTMINSYDGPGRSGTGQQYTLPVYFGPPNRPYVVLGSVDVETPVDRLFEGSAQTTTLKPAVRVAGQHGANAIIESRKMYRLPATARRVSHKGTQIRTSMPPLMATAFTAMLTPLRTHGVQASRCRIALVTRACWRLSLPDVTRAERLLENDPIKTTQRAAY